MKRKGFTLIELLAVIVILAIIAVIATPIIVGIIEDSRKAAFERSVEGILHATDLDFGTQEVLLDEPYTITNGVINKTLKTPIKNLEGFNGKIVYDENGNSQFAIHNGKWCMMKDDSGNITTSEYDASTCKLAVPLSDDCFVTEDLENGGVAIVDYLCTETDVIIPDTVNGKIVKEITGREVYNEEYDEYEYHGAFEAELVIVIEEVCEEWCEEYNPENCYEDCYDDYEYIYENQIKTIKIPNSVTNIGYNAFAHNDLSGELNLSNTNIISIGDGAFASNTNCDYDDEWNYICSGGITSIKLPSSITSIGTDAFAHNAISGELDLSMYTNLISVSGFGYNEIDSIKLPNTVTTIGNHAFSDNAFTEELDLSMYTNLTSVSGFDNNEIMRIKLPASVTIIGESAFKSNKINGELDLSYLANLESIEAGAFMVYWDSETGTITNVKLPNSLKKIGGGAFEAQKISGVLDLSNLTELTDIKGFSYNQIEKVIFPSNVTSISGFSSNEISGDLNLSMYTNLASVSGFDGNEITSIKLASSITYIGNYAFDWNNLTSVTFVGRSNLDGVTIGDNVWGWEDDHNESNSIFFE